MTTVVKPPIRQAIHHDHLHETSLYDVAFDQVVLTINSPVEETHDKPTLDAPHIYVTRYCVGNIRRPLRVHYVMPLDAD